MLRFDNILQRAGRTRKLIRTAIVFLLALTTGTQKKHCPALLANKIHGALFLYGRIVVAFGSKVIKVGAHIHRHTP